MQLLREKADPCVCFFLGGGLAMAAIERRQIGLILCRQPVVVGLGQARARQRLGQAKSMHAPSTGLIKDASSATIWPTFYHGRTEI